MKKMIFVRPPFEGMGYYRPPHYGIAMLLSYVKKSFGTFFEYEYIDALLDNLSVKDVCRLIKNKNPDVICITIKTMQSEQAKEMIKSIKESYSGLIICGGNHVSVDAETFIKCGDDYCVVGEGEQALVDILKYEFFDDYTIHNKNNILSKKYMNQKNSYGVITETDINKFGIADWSIIDIKRYNENIHMNKLIHALPIMASRGCPYRCDFCSSNLTWGINVRYRDPQLVIDEIKKSIKDYNIFDYHFYDDNLMINPQWVEKFLEKLEKENLGINWICLSRPEIIIKNKYLLHSMKTNGCKGFELGYETSNNDLYNNMNKKIKFHFFRKLIKYYVNINLK